MCEAQGLVCEVKLEEQVYDQGGQVLAGSVELRRLIVKAGPRLLRRPYGSFSKALISVPL